MEHLLNEMVDIPNIPGYKIDVYGNIYSFKRYKEGKKKNPYIDKDGYACVALRINGMAKAMKVHRLVAITFIENKNNHPQVNHKDANKLNNNVNNLEWVSNIQNQQHAWDLDLKTIKLTTNQVKEIKELIQFKNNTEIARIYNVDPSTISNIRTGKIWKRIKLDNI